LRASLPVFMEGCRWPRRAGIPWDDHGAFGPVRPWPPPGATEKTLRDHPAGPEGLFGSAVYRLLAPSCLVLADRQPCLQAFTTLRSANRGATEGAALGLRASGVPVWM